MQNSEDNSGSIVAPRHVAIIMDGNGRWAQARGKQRIVGHKKGADSVRTVISESAKMGVKELTLFAFSSENWKRPSVEVNALMVLFVQAIKKESQNLLKNDICTRVIGDISRFPMPLQKQIKKLEELTCNCKTMKLNIAANYGGRWDILQATSKIVRQCLDQNLNPDALTEENITSQLATMTDVDLMIRTGGEQRISNFLLWQAAYAEIYFSRTLWPDFNRDDLVEAFEFYAGRERRFGMTSDQIKSKDKV